MITASIRKKVESGWKWLKTRRGKYLITGLGILTVVVWMAWPMHLFHDPYSTVIEDQQGMLLGARTADDGQWRFPPVEHVPEKYKVALVNYEDQYFRYHPGVNLYSLGRSLWNNVRAGRIVSGGSTITMQVARLSRHVHERTLWGKFLELLMALRMELRMSKTAILSQYASHAPFGGNTVGIGAAAWRFFGKDAENLSWAEAATLAVLPNAPSLIHPGKNRDLLIIKRNLLLKKLCRKGYFDTHTLALACEEPLPLKPMPLPRLAPHLLDRVAKEKKGQRVRTSVMASLQQRVSAIVAAHQLVLEANQIHNAAVLVTEVSTGKVLAYVGNTSDPANLHSNDVDITSAERSTGSILKPILFSAMLDAGEILPGTLIPDIPTNIGGFSPKNFHLSYDGVVPAKRALERSLNIPAVRMLQNYGVDRFYHVLNMTGMRSLHFAPGHYGLSLILGGAEGTLWDLAGIYASMARTLNHYQQFNSRYLKKDFHSLDYLAKSKNEVSAKEFREHGLENGIMGAGAIYLTMEALLEVNRPDEESGWESYSSSRRIAWKTGTSFGYRDGWAIGTTPEYVVAVWVGNADGEGRPGLTGISAAAPILFDVFSTLPATTWFRPPYDDLVRIPVCRQSGQRPSEACTETDSIWVCPKGLRTAPCPYHRIVHLDRTGKFRVSSDCEDVTMMQHVSWFVLPPAQEYYYRSRSGSYKPLPPLKEGCRESAAFNPIEFIYPREEYQLYIPNEIDGSPGMVVFQAAHRDSDARLFWHLDNQYLGETKGNHQMSLHPATGKHVIVVVDIKGNSASKSFEVVRK